MRPQRHPRTIHPADNRICLRGESGALCESSVRSREGFHDIAPLASQPYVLVTGPSSGLKTASELIAVAKAKPPAEIRYRGTGSGTHFVAEKFKIAAGIDVIHVPYKGGPEANVATMTGQTTYWFPPMAIALKPVREGKLIALGVTGSKRYDGLPSVPSIAEAGVADFVQTTWWGIWAPAGIPARVADKLAKDVARAISSPDLRGNSLNSDSSQ